MFRKSVKISEVDYDKEFYSSSTKYIKRMPLHNGCFHRIQNASFGIGIEGTNIDCITAFNNDTIVDIDVATFSDIEYGDYFLYNNTKHRKVKFGHLAYALDDYNIILLDKNEEVIKL